MTKSITKTLRFQILMRDNFTCQYCGKTAEETKLHIDHVIPRFRGGTNVSTNLLTSCMGCNVIKCSSEINIPNHIIQQLNKPLVKLDEIPKFKNSKTNKYKFTTRYRFPIDFLSETEKDIIKMLDRVIVRKCGWGKDDPWKGTYTNITFYPHLMAKKTGRHHETYRKALNNLIHLGLVKVVGTGPRGARMIAPTWGINGLINKLSEAKKYTYNQEIKNIWKIQAEENNFPYLKKKSQPGLPPAACDILSLLDRKVVRGSEESIPWLPQILARQAGRNRKTYQRALALLLALGLVRVVGSIKMGRTKTRLIMPCWRKSDSQSENLNSQLWITARSKMLTASENVSKYIKNIKTKEKESPDKKLCISILS